MTKLTIGKVARRAGVSPSALRYYEARKLLPRAEQEGGRRIYDVEVLDRLAAIALAKAAGFTLGEIAALLEAPGSERKPATSFREVATAKRRDLERRIEELEEMRSLIDRLEGCTCPTLADCGRAFKPRAVPRPPVPDVPPRPSRR